MAVYTHTGVVVGTGPDRAPSSGLRVEAWGLDQTYSEFVGYAVTDSEGRYRFQLTEDDVAYLLPGRTPRVYFKVFNGTTLLTTTETSVVWRIHGDERPSLIQAPSSGTTETLVNYRVRGRLVDADGDPVATTQIKVFEKLLRSENELTAVGAPITTATDGSFLFEFPVTQLDSGRAVHDFIVRANGTSAESPTRYNAPPTIYVELVTDTSGYAGRSVFVELDERVTERIDGADPASLTSAEEDEVAEAAQVDVQDVRRYVAAKKVADEASTLQSAVFGMMRHGIRTDDVEIYHRSREELSEALERAKEVNDVSPRINETLVLDALQTEVRTRALTGTPAAGSTVNLGDVLDLAGLTAGEKDAFANRQHSHSRTAGQAQFWDDLENVDGISSTKVGDLQLVLQWCVLTRYHKPLLDELLTRKNAATVTTFRELAQYDESDWDSILAGLSTQVPADTPGADAAERRSNYAWFLTRSMEKAHPTASIGYRDGGSSDLSTFIANNHDFELGRTQLSTFLRGSPDYTGVSNQDTLRTRLYVIERLFQLSRRADHVLALEAAGYKSARSVARRGKDAFVSAMTATLGEGEAQHIYEKSALYADKATFLMAKYSAGAHAVKTAAIPETVVEESPTDPDLATWATLFGSGSQCACKHCQSVLSPAAGVVPLSVEIRWRLIGSYAALFFASMVMGTTVSS